MCVCVTGERFVALTLNSIGRFVIRAIPHLKKENRAKGQPNRIRNLKSGGLIKLIRRFIQKLGQLAESRINLSLLPVVIRRFSLNCGIYRVDVRS